MRHEAQVMDAWRANEAGFAGALASMVWRALRLPELRCAICGAHCLDQTTRIIANGETDQTCLCATYEVQS
jgi:hypothetical protein